MKYRWGVGPYAPGLSPSSYCEYCGFCGMYGCVIRLQAGVWALVSRYVTALVGLAAVTS